jgi:capsular exopolysaccharide synthesis family protein
MKVVDAVIAAYEDYLANSSNEVSREVLDLAEKATESRKQELDNVIREYSEFIQSVPAEFRAALVNRTQATQTQTNVSPQDVIRSYGDDKTKNRIKMSDLRSRLQALQKAIAAGESRQSLEYQVRRYLNSAEGRGADSANRSAEINIYQAQLLPLILKEKELSTLKGKNWPELITVRRNIELIVQKYRQLGVQLPEGVEDSIESQGTNPVQIDIVALYIAEVKQLLIELQIKEEHLDRLIEEEQNKTKEFADYQAKEQLLRDAVDSLREQWKKQSEKEQAAVIEKDSNGYKMTRLSDVKNALVIKRMLKFYFAGAAACMFLVALACVIRELMDLTIKTVRDVRDVIHQPVLGSIRQYTIPSDTAGPTSGIPHPALRYLHAPSSAEAEMYRTIRASLLVMTENLKANLLMVSSPEPSDGKTTLVCNLAVALAQSGKRVLLIDSDLRRPSVHHIFRVQQGAGLSEVLLGAVALPDAIRPTVVDRLSIITTGKPPSNPAEALSLPILHEILATVREQFDFVLIDAPPLLAVSDPCVVARQTDGILLLVRLNKNSRSALIRVRQLLADQEIPVIGAVINGVPHQGGHEYGYTYYGEYVSPVTSNGSPTVPQITQKTASV